MRPSELALVIASRFDDLDLVDKVSEAFLEHLGFDSEARPNLALAVREAAANAVQHGNLLDADQPVEILLRVERPNLLVQVCDQGPGFDPEALPDPLAPENLLKPTGRGILLIRNFMDSVTFEFPEAGGTRVSMRAGLPPPNEQKNGGREP